MEEAASHLHKLTEEERIRYQCEARERWLLFERSKRESRKKLEKELSDANQQISAKDQQIENLNAEIETLKAKLEESQK